jgi:hypothetical protein
LAIAFFEKMFADRFVDLLGFGCKQEAEVFVFFDLVKLGTLDFLFH